MSYIVVAKHVTLAGMALGGSYVIPYEIHYVQNLEGVKRQYVVVHETKQTTVPEEQLDRQQARDIQFMIANLIYETLGYPDSAAEQEEAYRVIATSVINKKRFEGKNTFEEVITEKNLNSKKKMVCQYSWFCEKGKPVDLKHLQREYGSRFQTAYKVAVEVVLGGFVPLAYTETEPFDGVYYATADAYKSPDNWHRQQVQKGRMCKRRTIDTHVFIAPNITGSCKDNQLAFYTGEMS
jgi:hypothetical protein